MRVSERVREIREGRREGGKEGREGASSKGREITELLVNGSSDHNEFHTRRPCGDGIHYP